MHRSIRAAARCAAPLLLAALASGCASVRTTEAGAIGLDRPQYFADGSREAMVKNAAGAYDRLLTLALKHHALNSDPAVTQRVTAIANRLIPHVRHYRPDAVDWAWEVNVLKVDVPNATCMAGGKISVYTGLLDQWKPTDDELAAVIGHEIGHALRDHSAEKFSTRQRNSGIASGLGAVLSVGLAVATGVNLGSTVSDATQLGAEAFGNLPNSRELEHESDRIGLELMARAGYDPRAAATLWTKVAERSRSEGESNKRSFWSTHPSDQTRIDDLVASEPRVRALYVAAAAENVRLAAAEAAEARRTADARPAATPSTLAMPAAPAAEALKASPKGTPAAKTTRSTSKAGKAVKSEGSDKSADKKADKAGS